MFYAGVLLVTIVFICSSIVTSNNTRNGDGLNRIYDVNRDGNINFQDAGLCWTYIQDDTDDPYGNLLYDVNMDGQVNFQDAGLIWTNRD